MTYSLANRPLQLPPLADMPYVLWAFKGGRLNRTADKDRLVELLGALPHPKVIKRWYKFLCNWPPSEFPGEPLYYQCVDGPQKVREALDLKQQPRDNTILSGEIFCVRSWRFEQMSCFQRLTKAEALGQAQRPWSEVRAMGWTKARQYLRELDIRGTGWEELEAEYRALTEG